MKLELGNLYNLSGGFIYGEETVEYIRTVLLTAIDSDGTVWAQDSDGDEFEVAKEDLSEINS